MTVAVREAFSGQVEVFLLTEHPLAKRAYGWWSRAGERSSKIVTVLEIPPVNSAKAAVHLQMSKK